VMLGTSLQVAGMSDGMRDGRRDHDEL